ncbi:MAG: hypothetical protein MSC47_06370 [Oscillibacter sp.]|nr:hypothetical protein [Oscillibacter sp.]
MIKRRLALLALEGVLLLTACGQTKDVSTLTTPPPQSAAQVIAPVEDKTEMPQKEEKTEDSADALLPVERVDTPTDAEAEKNPTPAETAPPAAPKEPTTPAPAPEDKPAPAPTPAPAQKPAEKQEEEPAPAPTPEPAPTPKPAASGNIYSIAEAVRAGNEYARAQYGVTIDTSMTAADSSYFPGTADSVAWLAENGGQMALTAAVRGNVDATFACLAAMDGAETVSAYARFNCTARYDATSDEYIVVVLYG